VRDLLNRLIGQLDGLVAFLALAHEEVSDVVRHHYEEWLPSDQQSVVPDSLAVFKLQVTHGAFVLGYSYFEAYLADIAREVYRRRPKLLPEAKELKYSDILDCPDYESVLATMIEKEVKARFNKGLVEVAKHYSTKFNVTWPDVNGPARASLIRNCLVHNKARANERLAVVSSWEIGDSIELSATDVHEAGLVARSVARAVCDEADRRHPETAARG